MAPTAFTSSFTPSALATGNKPFSGDNLCTTRPRTRGPVAVLGVRTSNVNSFGAQPSQTYEVKVVEPNKCTVIQVDRDTDLRKALLDNKIDLYTLKGKLTNCGGGGQCGTCLIEVESGYTNGRTAREDFLLQNKPDSYRLACRTLISGDVTIKTKPRR